MIGQSAATSAGWKPAVAPVSKEYGKPQPLRAHCLSFSRYRPNRLPLLCGNACFHLSQLHMFQGKRAIARRLCPFASPPLLARRSRGPLRSWRACPYRCGKPSPWLCRRASANHLELTSSNRGNFTCGGRRSKTVMGGINDRGTRFVHQITCECIPTRADADGIMISTSTPLDNHD